MTPAQQLHRMLGITALVALAVTLFLVGLAAFRDPQPQALGARAQAAAVSGPVAARHAAEQRLDQLRDVVSDGDTSVDRILWAAVAILAIALAMLALAALGDAPTVFVRLTTVLVALSALDAVLVLTRGFATALAAAQVLAVAGAMLIAARIIGRHALLDAPWHRAT